MCVMLGMVGLRSNEEAIDSNHLSKLLCPTDSSKEPSYPQKTKEATRQDIGFHRPELADLVHKKLCSVGSLRI